MPDGGDGERGIVFADTAGVFAEAHIERPVQGIFDGPVTAGVGQDTGRIGSIVGNLTACLKGGFITHAARGGDMDDALQFRPVMLLLQPFDPICNLAAADFEAAMTFISIFVYGEDYVCRRLLEE